MARMKLFVEVCNGADLMPKDGQGSASPYCTIEFEGQQRTTEAKAKTLNPVWNQTVEFIVEDAVVALEHKGVDVTVYTEKRGPQKKPGFLGRVRVPGRSIAKKGEEALVYYPLERRSVFSHVKGELGLKVWWSAEEVGEAASAPVHTEAAPPQPTVIPSTEIAAAAAPSSPPSTAVEAPHLVPEAVPAAPIEEIAARVLEPEVVTRVVVPPVSPPPDPLPASPSVPLAPDPPPAEQQQQQQQHQQQQHQQQQHQQQQQQQPPKEVKVKKAEEPVVEYRSVEKESKQQHSKKEADREEQHVHKVIKQEAKRMDREPAAPAIMINRDYQQQQQQQQQVPKKLARASTVPSSEFGLKETKPAISGRRDKAVSYDLVEKMHYLFVRVVKARGLAEGGATYARIVFGSLMAKTRMIGRTHFPEWHEVFAFSKEASSGPVLEVSIRENESDRFLGVVGFDLQEVPTRVPPDSPLAPQWYRLEGINGSGGVNGDAAVSGSVRGDLMLSVWWGTQADEAFTEAWQSDSGGFAHTRSKVYLSPKLWYLRVNVVEAQEVQPTDKTRFPEVSVRAQLGFQVQKTKVSSNKSASPFWNEDLLFVAAEPFEDDLVLFVQNRTGGGSNGSEEEVLGVVKVSLTGIERRVDHRLVASRWYNLDRYVGSGAATGGGNGHGNGERLFHGRLHLRLCFDGGYHVMEESSQYLSCVRPTARQLWRPPVGLLELGILRGKEVLPMKTVEGRGSTDAYVVAKYGPKWVRTRTVVDNLNPRWNEQYSWEVYDPCTVLTVGVFDNCHVYPSASHGGNGGADLRIGKVRLRVSTLESGRVYSNGHPLLCLQRSGVRKLGEVELAVRYTSGSLLSVMALYFRPLLPRMHYTHPLGVTQAEVLRISALRLVALRLARSEPPLRQEVVLFMLDSGAAAWSLRRAKANYFRIMRLLAAPLAVGRWLADIRAWRSPVTTLLVHALFLILVLYPELVLPTVLLYCALIACWRYRYRPRAPAGMDAALSQAEAVEPEELEEEFDTVPTSAPAGAVAARYDRLRVVSARMQGVLGDVAAQGERLAGLLSWRDPRASGTVAALCLVAALVLYVVPLRVVVALLGLYLLRHPRFRDPMPTWPVCFFRRLPSLADRIL